MRRHTCESSFGATQTTGLAAALLGAAASVIDPDLVVLDIGLREGSGSS